MAIHKGEGVQYSHSRLNRPGETLLKLRVQYKQCT